MFFPTEPPKAFAQSQNIPYNFMSSSSNESFLFFPAKDDNRCDLFTGTRG